MPDERTYIRVHDGMPDHPKIEGLSDAAFRLLVTVWCWCSRYLTDGIVPTATWAKRGTPRARGELVAAGLVQVTPSGVAVHDYTEHQRSADEVAAYREMRRLAGVAGNHQRWHVGRRMSDPGCELCAIAPGIADAIAKPVRLGSQTSRKTVASTETETEEKTKTIPPLRGGSGRGAGAGGRPRAGTPTTDARASAARATRLPEGWTPSPDLLAWAAGRVPEVDALLETEKFTNHWRAASGQAATKHDWSATWRNWLLRARPTTTPLNGSNRNGSQINWAAAMDRALAKEAADPCNPTTPSS